MNINELVDAVAADVGLSKAQTKSLVEGVLGAIRDAAVKGEEVSLSGFGKFKVQNKPARTARNPATGATVDVPATRKVVFQPAKALKDAVAA